MRSGNKIDNVFCWLKYWEIFLSSILQSYSMPSEDQFGLKNPQPYRGTDSINIDAMETIILLLLVCRSFIIISSIMVIKVFPMRTLKSNWSYGDKIFRLAVHRTPVFWPFRITVNWVLSLHHNVFSSWIISSTVPTIAAYLDDNISSFLDRLSTSTSFSLLLGWATVTIRRTKNSASVS